MPSLHKTKNIKPFFTFGIVPYLLKVYNTKYGSRQVVNDTFWTICLKWSFTQHLFDALKFREAKMKDIGPKRLLFTLLTGTLMLIFGIYVIPDKYHFLSVLLSFLCAAGCQLWWMVLYDQYDPKADIFGMGFAKNRFPVFVEKQSRMNFLVFSTYKWILICIILLYCGKR